MIQNVKNPIWANAQDTAINCEVETAQYGWIPYTASASDPEPYGIELWVALNAGTYGPIAPYVAPIPPVPTAEQNKQKASDLLYATDWTSIADVASPTNNPYLTNQAEFLAYRSELRKVAVNPVAGNLDWPTAPTPTWSA